MKTPDEQPIESVTGIGGVFFKAQDPGNMAGWYAKNLGIQSGEWGAEFLWREEKNPEVVGRTAWSLFEKDSAYFGPSGQPYMINYRVANLDRLLEQLRRNGVAVIRVEDVEYGRFAWITDPEGNRIELWEPLPK